MADFSRSSFIPKEASGTVPNRIRRRRTFHIFGFIATVMLIGSLALAGGVFFLKTTAEKNLESAKQSLIEQKSLFKDESISEVREFDRKLKAAELLIQNHISPLKIFAALETDTMAKVQLTGLDIEHTPTYEVLVTLNGKTSEFKSLALQEIEFSLNTILDDMVFEKVTTVSEEEATSRVVAIEEPSVIFSLKGSLTPSSILYDGFTPSTAEGQTASTIFNSAVLGEAITIE